MLDRINPAVGMVESISATSRVLVTGADSLDTLAAYIGMLGMDFIVESPAELRPHLRHTRRSTCAPRQTLPAPRRVR